MVQLTQSAMKLGSGEFAISPLRPTIYRPSRPTTRVTTPDQRDAETLRRPATRATTTPERAKGTVKRS